jgi:DNA invertase Pin-like site-specific DNA recombinase
MPIKQGETMIAKGKPPTATLPAAAYIRMSSDQQEGSPAQQRAALPKLASEYGYRIVREYVDEGISGAESKKRPQFMQMIADAQAGKFKAILLWDQDRFARFDPMEANHYWHLLREAGVEIITVAQGRLNWDDLGGWLTASINQHAKNQYLHDLARNTTRGKIENAKAGRPNNRPPWGYDRAFYDAAGKLVCRAIWGDPFKKSPNWKTVPIISEDAAIVGCIRRIFKEYSEGSSLRAIVTKLNAEGVPSPTGKTWKSICARAILENPAYMGDLRYGETTKGKFCNIGDDMRPVKAGERSGGKAVIYREGAWKGIIDRKTFEACQRRLIANRSRTRSRNATYLLSSILRCGHCGGQVVGKTSRRWGNTYRSYVCSGHANRGNCAHRATPADALEQAAIAMVQDELFSDANLERLQKAVRAEAKARSKAPSADSAPALKKQVDKLRKQIERGVENLAKADPEDFAAVQTLLRQWRAELVAVEAQIRPVAASSEKDVEKVIRTAMAAAKGLLRALRDAEPSKAKSALEEVFDSITLHWGKRGTNRISRLERAVVVFVHNETKSVAGCVVHEVAVVIPAGENTDRIRNEIESVALAVATSILQGIPARCRATVRSHW